ncbi:MAG: 2-phospho-L-lactate guanylyltransferase [Deltaproteobacteria bacterium RIFCSPLOWO2_12_FULL_60_19]|nr:MAG: 2-phospho-L-lactate guanylyltransferase [Deltaproteobacteria bacterium RIFCSPLOWO2_12_FULL_60_19]
MKVSALIPAKGFANAKQRLSALLNEPERALLAETMLRDVLRQTLLARGLESTHVVTGDRRVREIAASLGAEVIIEEKEAGETEAVTYALAEMKHRGIQAALIIPADIPLLRAGDIELVLGQAARHDGLSPFALLVPSHDRMGTNALLLSPPDLIQLRFGYDSFSYHLSQVAAQELPLRVLENERIGLDIDEPQDLERFILSGDGAAESYGKVMEMRRAADARRSGDL